MRNKLTKIITPKVLTPDVTVRIESPRKRFITTKKETIKAITHYPNGKKN